MEITRVVDIEVTPSTVLMYGKWFDPVILEELDREKIASISWLSNGGKVQCRGIWDMPSYKGKWTEKAQKELAIFCRDLINEADIIVGHNSDKYDIKKINSECLYYRIEPPRENKTFDTKKLSGKYGDEPTKRLAYLAPKYTGGGKLSHEGYKTYIKAVAGDKKAQKELRAYNNEDVVRTWELYKLYLPFITRERTAWQGKRVCPQCGGVNTQSRGIGKRHGGLYRRFQCMECLVANNKSWFYGEKIINKPTYAHP